MIALRPARSHAVNDRGLFVIRKSRLNVRDLYRQNGLYEYDNGINGRAVIALVVGIAVGFGVSGLVYLLTMQRAEGPAQEPEWEAEG